MAKDVFGVGSTGVRSVSPVASLVQGLFQRVMQEPQRRQAMEAAKRQSLLEQAQVEEAPLRLDILKAQKGKLLAEATKIGGPEQLEEAITEEEALRRGKVGAGTRIIRPIAKTLPEQITNRIIQTFNSDPQVRKQ